MQPSKLQEQREQTIISRRHLLQNNLQEQRRINEEINCIQQKISPTEEKMLIGTPPLDTDRIAVLGTSVGGINDHTVWIGGFSVCWLNDVHPAQVSSYVCLFGGNFYPELMAVKTALAACPPKESLTILTHSVQLLAFLNNQKSKGKRRALTEKIEQEVRSLIDAKPAKVCGIECRDDWTKIIRKHATKLATYARKLREAEDPSLPPTQQEALDTMLQHKKSVAQALSATPATPRQAPLRSDAPASQPATSSSKPPATAPLPTDPAQQPKPASPRYQTRSSTSSLYGPLPPTPSPPRETLRSQRYRDTGSTRPLRRRSERIARPSRFAPQNLFHPGYVPQNPFHPGYVPPPFPAVLSAPGPPHAPHQQTDRPAYERASRRVSPSLPDHAGRRAVPSQYTAPISQNDARIASRESAGALSGNPRTQHTASVGNRSVGKTAWNVPQTRSHGPVDVDDGPTTATTADERSGQSAKRKIVVEDGESQVSKKFKALAVSDDDDVFFDAEEGQKNSWTDWFGGVVKNFF